VRAESTRYRQVRFLARWPSNKAMRHARDRIRELTDRRRLLLPVEVIVQDVNRVLRGWAGYFRYGNSARRFDKIRSYALLRLALVVAKRHHRSRARGWSRVCFQIPNQLGLISLNGIVVAPRPFKPWRERSNAGGERRR
jgi:RNA-directed DNA polymerase